MHEHVNVLLVEDNDVDIEGIQRAFARHQIRNPVVVAKDGLQALDRLRGEGGNPPLERPYMILLDLNLPRMDGIEFLEELRQDPSLRDSVVFVLTTSRSIEDKIASYDFNVAGYMVKGEVGESFAGMVDLLDRYWKVNEFPPERME